MTDITMTQISRAQREYTSESFQYPKFIYTFTEKNQRDINKTPILSLTNATVKRQVGKG